MGAQQSKSVPITPEAGMHEKAVLERLRSLRVDADDDADDYVHVGDEKNAAATIYDAVSDREPEGLAVEVLESWQSKLLRDPKNRSVCTPLPTSSFLGTPLLSCNPTHPWEVIDNRKFVLPG